MQRTTMPRASAADLLTVLRIAAAAVLGAALAGGHRAVAAVLLSIAWVSDAADGRAARRAGRRGRLGGHDLTADTLVGLAVATGGAFAGRWSWWLAAGAIGLAVGWTLTGNDAWAMAAQAVGYGAFLRDLVLDRVAGWWVPVATIAILAVVERRRLIAAVLPGFLDGVRRPLRPHRLPPDRGAGPPR